MDIDDTRTSGPGALVGPLPDAPVVTTRQWTPDRQREGVRTLLVVVLVLATVAAYAGMAIWVMAGSGTVDDATKLAGIFSPVVALTGGAVGFYFSKP